jgi:Pin2-interacting protein X1
MVSTSTLSVSEYFRQKMRAKTIARQIAAGETPAVEPEPTASSSKIAWEGTRMAFVETDTPLLFSDSPVPAGKIAPTETKEERRAAKARRKAEKEARRAGRAGNESTDTTKKKRKRGADEV